ncbi:MAG: universal stress protein [Planctomycetota bacterium]
MKVLLATDGSKCSEEAAWVLSRLPHREKLELTVLTVLSPPATAFYSPTKDLMEEMVREDRAYAEKRQTVIAEMFEGANLDLSCEVIEGNAQETIVDLAKQRDSDLIVIGAKGHSKIDRILLGSTSDYVATHAPCSVLVVRPTGLREDHERSLKVAVAFDDSPASNAALDELLQFRWGAHTVIDVVAVAGYTPVFNPDFGFNPEALQREAQKAVDIAAERLMEQVDQVEKNVIENDHIAEGLVRYSEQTGADFLMIGDTGRSSIARVILGSVSRYVLRHAACGVWITRHSRRTSSESTDHGGSENIPATS